MLTRPPLTANAPPLINPPGRGHCRHHQFPPTSLSPITVWLSNCARRHETPGGPELPPVAKAPSSLSGRTCWESLLVTGADSRVAQLDRVLNCSAPGPISSLSAAAYSSKNRPSKTRIGDVDVEDILVGLDRATKNPPRDAFNSPPTAVACCPLQPTVTETTNSIGANQTHHHPPTPR